jgi:transcription antitermination factor NusG
MGDVTQAVALDSREKAIHGTVPPAPPRRVIPSLISEVDSVAMTLCDVPVHDFIGRWYAAKIKGREEKEFARALAQRQVPYFLLLHTREYKDVRGQRRGAREALLPGYIFICGGSAEMYRAAECRNFFGWVDGLLSCAAQDRLRGELASWYQVLSVNPVIHVNPPARVGQTVRIARGPLLGVRGVVTSMGRFVLKLSACDFAAEIEIDPTMVEAA